MDQDEALDHLADRFGIVKVFRDLNGQVQNTSVETRKALLRANGLQLDTEVMTKEVLEQIRADDAKRKLPQEIVITSGAASSIPFNHQCQWSVEAETSGAVLAEGRGDQELQLPALASGVYVLRVRGNDHQQEVLLIAAPRMTPSVVQQTGAEKLWGLNAALYGLRSKRNFGLGDFGDLAEAAAGLAGHGAGFMGINPVHALGWADDETISPYSPSHRGFINTAHIALDQLFGAETSEKAQEILQQGKQASSILKAQELIDYPEYNKQHKSRLTDLYGEFARNTDKGQMAVFEAFCHERGVELDQFAIFEAISEIHGPDWRSWPVNLRSPASSDVEDLAGELAERIRFHQWLQWLAHEQLSHAQQSAKAGGMALGLYLDLAVGARRGGAESWCEQEVIAKDVSLGAPPDHLSPAGQNWDLAAFAPEKLRRNRYRAFRHVLAEAMRYCGLLRIDHVLGFNRSYWIPDDGSPGGYIKQPFEVMLALVAIEAERTGTIIVGEDLGLVPEGFRDTLNRHGLYGYSVFQYERDEQGRFRHPGSLREMSLACFGTHDTPTLAGFAQGRDIDWWRDLGWVDEQKADQARQQRQIESDALRGVGTPGEFEELNDQVHDALAKSPAAMISVQLDDVLGQVEAQNLPGTIDEHPNWRRRCPIEVEELPHNAQLARTASLMAQADRRTQMSETDIKTLTRAETKTVEESR